MFEAILYVCLTLGTAQWSGDQDTAATCVYMNSEKRSFPTLNQCKFWVKQGVQTIQTREHYDRIRGLLGTSKDGQLTVKGKCEHKVFENPFTCKDCEL